MFEEAILHQKNKALTMAPPPPQQLDDQSKTQHIFFHIGYHPENVNSFEYQRKFKEKHLNQNTITISPILRTKPVMKTKLIGWLLHNPTQTIWSISFHTKNLNLAFSLHLGHWL